MSHICEVCSRRAEDHEPHCSYGEPRSVLHHMTDHTGKSYDSTEHTPTHTHYPTPLCCPECACLSWEEAHPAAVGTPLESLAEILHSRTLSTRTVNLLARHQVWTAERLIQYAGMRLFYDRHMGRGFGPVTAREIYLTKSLLALARMEGEWTPKPLPEDVEHGTLLIDWAGAELPPTERTTKR